MYYNEFNKKIKYLNKNISVVICIEYYKIIIKGHLTKEKVRNNVVKKCIRVYIVYGNLLHARLTL